MKQESSQPHAMEETDWAGSDQCNSRKLGKSIDQLRDLLLIRRKRPRNVETVVLKWVVTEGRNS